MFGPLRSSILTYLPRTSTSKNAVMIQDPDWPSDRRARNELVALALTGALHLLFESVLAQKTLFLIAAGIGWVGYLGLSVARRPGRLRDWGLWPAPLRSFRLPALVFLAGAAALGVTGALLGHRLLLPLHSLALFALYPIWGFAQQFLLQALLTRNLRGFVHSGVLVTILAATLFGVVHAPDTFLMAATFALGLLFTPVYLRERSILPLGLFHGFLGVLAFYWLLGRDPYLELLGG